MMATTDNYATAALHDETGGTSHEQADTAAGPSRAARIARAVERSRLEYKPEHAYTERGWMLAPNTDRTTADLVDKHLLEYKVTSLYYTAPPSYREALDLVLEAFTPDKPLGGLTRERIDAGTRFALACGDIESGVKIAKAGAQNWRPPFTGLAESAADAFIAAGHPDEAFRPLLLASSAGLHRALVDRLARLVQHRSEPDLQVFHSALARYSGSIDVDQVASCLQLDPDLVEPLRDLARRLLRGAVEDPKANERSVRDL